MASPFSIFRKNQKMLLVAATLLAMFGFVFIPIIMDQMGGRTIANPVAVETSEFGDLRDSNVEHLRKQRQKVLSVLSTVMQMSGVHPVMVSQFLEARFGPATEESVVNSWLMAQHAEQMGMVVSNKIINEFMGDLTQNRVKPNDFITAFKRSGITELQFFHAMREEMLALQLRNIFSISLAATTPSQRWDYFNRVKQMATIEAVPVAVADYVDKIAEPTDDELKAFFEENKRAYSHPQSPKPGFHQPQKVALEYFMADAEKFASPENVTEEEIQRCYEKDKEFYDQFSKGTEKETPAVADEKKLGNEDVKESAQDAEKSAAPTEESKQPKEELKKEAKESTKEKESKETAAVGDSSPFRLVSLLQEEKQSESEAVEKSEKPTEKTQEPPTQEKPKEAKGGLSESLKKRIRQDIANEKIQKIFRDIQEQLEQHRQVWSKYKVVMIRDQAKNKQKKKKLGPPPVKPDFEKLAKEHGLSVGRTDLLPQWETQNTELGMAHPAHFDENGQLRLDWNARVWQRAYQSLAELRSEIATDMRGNLYLFWKTKEQKDYVPKFEDEGVREEVLRSWKLIQARERAMKQAESLAAEARKADKFLKQVFADRPELDVVQPMPFSWMTFGNVPLGSASNARLSTVSGIEFAGNEFMQEVFKLEPGQVGVAMNAPKSIAYVLRVTEFNPSYKVRWKQFEVDDFSKYASAGQGDRQQIAQDWLKALQTSAGLKWLRPYDQAGDAPRSQR